MCAVLGDHRDPVGRIQDREDPFPRGREILVKEFVLGTGVLFEDPGHGLPGSQFLQPQELVLGDVHGRLEGASIRIAEDC